MAAFNLQYFILLTIQVETHISTTAVAYARYLETEKREEGGERGGGGSQRHHRHVQSGVWTVTEVKDGMGGAEMARGRRGKEGEEEGGECQHRSIQGVDVVQQIIASSNPRIREAREIREVREVEGFRGFRGVRAYILIIDFYFSIGCASILTLIPAVFYYLKIRHTLGQSKSYYTDKHKKILLKVHSFFTSPLSLAPRPSPLAPRPSPLAPRPSPLAPRPSPLAPRPSPLAPRPYFLH